MLYCFLSIFIYSLFNIYFYDIIIIRLLASIYREEVKLMNVSSKDVVVSATFRLLLNRAQDKKIQELRKALADVGEVEKCEIDLNFYRCFNAKGRRVGRRILIPMNGLGVAQLILHFENGISIPFYAISTFDQLGQFLSDVNYYAPNPEYYKRFSVEETDTLQRFIVISVKLVS